MHAAQCALLRGAICAAEDDAVAAAREGANFLVTRELLADGELAAPCEKVDVPVFARGVRLENAWALGASGCNQIDA